jgi:hypothetical protein
LQGQNIPNLDLHQEISLIQIKVLKHSS